MNEVEESLKNLMRDTARSSDWNELCAIFLYYDDATKLKNYSRSSNGEWESYDAGDFELIDWFDEYMEQDANIKSIKAVLSSNGNFLFRPGYDVHEIFTNENDHEIINIL
jgi:hypothetical protein